MIKTDDALLCLLQLLKRRGYQFTTPTPASHARVMARSDRGQARCVEDVLGWNLPFDASVIDPEIVEYLHNAGAIAHAKGLLRSLIRVSSLGGCLYLHSGFPTTDTDAVFFGPDSYRFANLIETELAGRALGTDKLVVDIGTGAGVGAIVATQLNSEATVVMTEINPAALRFARINAAAAGVNAKALYTNRLDGIDGTIDVALANPPYIIDSRKRMYRDGGRAHGAEVTINMASFTLPRLGSSGRLILYSGSAIIAGRDLMMGQLGALASEYGCRLNYRELDPDVFGEELGQPAYADVDRIALIAAIFERS